MKKIIAISLFSLLLLKIGGLTIFLGIERELMREAIFSKIDKGQNINNLTCIVDTKNIEWEEENKEFWYEGKLYDVAKIEIHNGLRNYYCLADDNETELVTVIKSLVENHDSPMSQTAKSIIGWFFQLVVIPEIEQIRFKIIIFSFS